MSDIRAFSRALWADADLLRDVTAAAAGQTGVAAVAAVAQLARHRGFQVSDDEVGRLRQELLSHELDDNALQAMAGGALASAPADASIKHKPPVDFVTSW